MKKYRKCIMLLIFVAHVLAGIFYVKSQYVVPIIMYHRIDNNAAVSKLSVTPESFKRQMQFFKKHNYNVVSLEELAGLVKAGKIPYKTVSITFDDGYENNYIKAYPVLKKLELPATIFISPALIGIDGYLTWAQIIEMSENGVISIGSHAMTHAYLPDLAEQKLNIEIYDSKRAIESHIRKKIVSFSYPVGAFNSYIKNKVVRTGYKIAVATNPGGDYPKHDLFAMKRVRISRTSDSLLVFWIETSGFYTWIKEIRDDD